MKTPIKFAYLLVILFFTICLLSANYEFLIYAVTVAAVVFIIQKTDAYFNYKNFALWSFTLWVAMHISGGFLKVNGGPLYDLILINIVGEPYNILKYDQLVHTFCYFFFSLLVFSVVEKITSKDANKVSVAILVVLASIGIGSINEIIEFSTTIFWENGVGGYVNNSIDLIANLIGAIIGALIYPKIKN